MPECSECGSDRIELRPRVSLTVEGDEVVESTVPGGKARGFCKNCESPIKVYFKDLQGDLL